MKKNIYIDFNILTAYMKEKKDRNVISDLQNMKKMYNIYCSPAHFEEIAKIYRKNQEKGREYIACHIEYLKELTSNNIIYFPYGSINDRLEFMKQDFYKILYRVMNDAGIEKTQEVEEDDAKAIEAWKKIRAMVNTNQREIPDDLKCLDTKRVSAISPEDIFQSDAMNFICERTRWPGDKIIMPESLRNIYKQDLKGPFGVFEGHVECAMKLLNYCGYHSDTTNLGSVTHDISHAHYGSKCDYFVTRDKKFSYRIRAAYFWLGVPTHIILISKLADLLSALQKN